MEDIARPLSTPLAEIAAQLHVGQRTALALCRAHGALLAGGGADLARLLRGLGVSEAVIADRRPGRRQFWTTAELAERLNCSPRTIRAYAEGRGQPAHFPRSLRLTAHHRVFFVGDVDQMEFHVSAPIVPSRAVMRMDAQPRDWASERAPAADHVAVPEDFEGLIPAASKRKRGRKK